MIFHENRLLADDSHVISHLLSKNVAQSVVCCSRDWRFKGFFLSKNHSHMHVSDIVGGSGSVHVAKIKKTSCGDYVHLAKTWRPPIQN